MSDSSKINQAYGTKEAFDMLLELAASDDFKKDHFFEILQSALEMNDTSCAIVDFYDAYQE